MFRDMDAVAAWQKELHRVADDIEDSRRLLTYYREDLADAWRSADEADVDAALATLVERLSSAAKDAEDISARLFNAAVECEAGEII